MTRPKARPRLQLDDNETPPPGTVVIRIGDVQRKTGFSVGHIYKRMARGEFPRPIKLGKRATAWSLAEIDQWIQERLDARNGDAA